MSKIQLNLPEILKHEQTKEDLFKLPQEALEIIFGHSATCLSEYELFKAISERIKSRETEELKEIAEEANSG